MYDVSNIYIFPSRVKFNRTKGRKVDELSGVKRLNEMRSLERVNDDFTFLQSVRLK